jgi:hypothetical protein
MSSAYTRVGVKGGDLTIQAFELLALAQVLAAAVYQRLRPEVSRREAQPFAAEVMETVVSSYDTSLLEREFIRRQYGRKPAAAQARNVCLTARMTRPWTPAIRARAAGAL